MSRTRFLMILLAASMLAAGTLDAATSFTFSTLAGTPGTVVNSADGTGSAAQFDAPRGVAVGQRRQRLCGRCDESHHPQGHAIRRGDDARRHRRVSAHTDGTGAAARFHEPFDVAVDSSGNLYVADSLSAAIRQGHPSRRGHDARGRRGCGQHRRHGHRGAASTSRAGWRSTASGTVYVADYENELIRKITSAGVVTTLAGGVDTRGNTDGTGTAARFQQPK